MGSINRRLLSSTDVALGVRPARKAYKKRKAVMFAWPGQATWDRESTGFVHWSGFCAEGDEPTRCEALLADSSEFTPYRNTLYAELATRPQPGIGNLLQYLVELDYKL